MSDPYRSEPRVRCHHCGEPWSIYDWFGDWYLCVNNHVWDLPAGERCPSL